MRSETPDINTGEKKERNPNDEEWYTPPHLLELVYAVLGNPVDMDPCSEPAARNVRASIHYTKQDNGLSKAWNGRIYLNPPYGHGIQPWIKKLVQEFDAGRIDAAIALVPTKTDTNWWYDLQLRTSCWCGIKGRVVFLPPEGVQQSKNGGKFPSAVVLLAHDPEDTMAFIEAFSAVGIIYKKSRFTGQKNELPGLGQWTQSKGGKP